MSVPKQIPSAARPPSYASSPSKSSLRSQKSAVERRSISSPNLEDDTASLAVSPRQTNLPIEEGHAGLTSQEHVEEAPHDLQPLFTLLYDTQTSEHHHPAVHYIFTDDDTDIITEAALRSLADQEDIYSADAQSGNAPEAADAGVRSRAGELPSEKRRVKEHYIIVDVAATETHKPHEAAAASRTSETTSTIRPGPLQLTASIAAPTRRGAAPPLYPFQVTAASSLSPSFAVVSANIVSAPTFDPPSPVATAKNRRLSLADPQVLGLGIQGQGQTGGSNSAVTARPDNEDRAAPLMLKLEGISAFDVQGVDTLATVTARGHGKAQKTSIDTVIPAEKAEESLEELVVRFEERLAEIKMVMDAAGGNEITMPGQGARAVAE